MIKARGYGPAQSRSEEQLWKQLPKISSDLADHGARRFLGYHLIGAPNVSRIAVTLTLAASSSLRPADNSAITCSLNSGSPGKSFVASTAATNSSILSSAFVCTGEYDQVRQPICGRDWPGFSHRGGFQAGQN
jgi:hypothetical protein